MPRTSDGHLVRGWIGDGPELWPVRVRYVAEHDPVRDTPLLRVAIARRYNGPFEWGVASAGKPGDRPCLGAMLHVAATTLADAVELALDTVVQAMLEVHLVPVEIEEVTVFASLGPTAD